MQKHQQVYSIHEMNKMANLYELREVAYNSLDRKVDVLTFYADSDETAIITATVHPFRLTVLELNRIVSEENEINSSPTLLNRMRLLDKESMVKYPDLSGTYKLLQNESVMNALNSYMRLTPKERIFYDKFRVKLPDNLIYEFDIFVKLLVKMETDYLKYSADSVERRKLHSNYLYNGWVGISS
jgi:hypothetical protein